MGTVAAITAVVGTTYSVKKQKQAARAQRKQIRANNRAKQIANARARRKAAAEAARARAQSRSEAAVSGAVGSSAAQGAEASIISQQASALGFSNVQQAGAELAAGFATDASRASSQAAIGQAVANLPGQLGLEPDLSTLFSDKPKTP